MTEATWSDEAKTPPIDWRMSAALENVPRGDMDVAEIANLEATVRTWLGLDAVHRERAILTPERPILLEGVSHTTLTGEAIALLADHLPSQAGGA